MVNYTGHGSEVKLAQESLLTLEQINQYKNINTLPFFITATCEFGRYDNPALKSGAEYLLMNPNGGACGIITSTRIVYEWSNQLLNGAVIDYIFINNNGKFPALGDVIRQTKNKSNTGINNRNYALLGDPSMTLSYPKNKVIVTKINDKILNKADTLKALGQVSIEGEIQNYSGTLLNSYNGTINLTVYDKQTTVFTLGTQDNDPSISFKTQNNYIYDGIGSVVGGKYKIQFIVPKDISYLFDYGKISLYSKAELGSVDANGFNDSIIIGGTDLNAKPDSASPQSKLFMNDESFVFGGTTGENALFLAKLSDENGINVSNTGIGHEITADLDNSNNLIILNDFYTPVKDSYKEGYVRYPFKNLEQGNHSIKFKCWDTYNNSSESYLEFVVAKDEKLAINHVLNYPNPFSTNTTFHFDHNKAGDDLDVMIQIFTISGKLIKTLETTVFRSEGHFSDLSWDGRDDFGDKIGKGVYVYKVRLKSIREGKEISKFEKLVLLN